MNKIFLLSAIVILTMAFETEKTKSRGKHRIKVAVDHMDNDTAQYFYNADGRISRLQDSKGNHVNYVYQNNKIFRTYVDILRGRSFTDTLVLNSDGLVESITSNNLADISEKREFNGDKYMTRTTLYNRNGSRSGNSIYQYKGGNLSSDTTYTVKNGDVLEINSYEYDMSHSNTIGDDNTGEEFIGADNINPLKSSMSKLINLEPIYYTYNYHYDAQGRITIEAVYETQSGKLTDSMSYIYY